MINSISKELNNITLPNYEGEVSMIAFDLNNLHTLPIEFVETVSNMIINLKNKTGKAYLTVHGKLVKASETMRRGAPHIDGNYLTSMKWGSTGGWKIGENGNQLNTVEHKLSYENKNGGMLIASNYSACKGWNGVFNGKAGIGGDCRHIDLGEGFMLESNKVYYGNSQFIHESLPLDKDVFRVLFRITLPIDHAPIN